MTPPRRQFDPPGTPPGDGAAPEADRHVLLAGHVLFAVLLALGAVRAAMASSTPVVPVLAALATAGWYGVGAVWVSRKRGRIARLWLAGLILIWLGLVVLSGEFVWLAFLLALLVWHLFPVRAAIPIEVTIALAAAIGFAAHQGRWVAGAIFGPVIGVACAAVMTEIYQRLRAQSDERRRLLEELMRTQEALAIREHEAGRLAERERLAREIHDTVGQSLASVIMLLRAALRPSTPTDRSEQLHTALDTATGALAETRRFVLGLNPAALERDGFTQALRSLADDSSAFGLRTDFEQHGTPRMLPTGAQVALLRAAQEALSNARRHAAAESATMTLTYQDDEVSIDVVDDGVGFDPAAHEGLRADGTGYGLTAMRSRLAERGGDVTVESEAGAGTAVRATIPVVPEATVVKTAVEETAGKEAGT
ncbi:sensor histidine kinase [Gordonia sp. SL306]|uniref:sensor histidine kinase n=1 Tax=Gordonia sp. SL306 TaxID=2995145 RepID=UPI00226DA877|nr:sensor histidine kinase [Gordonia sp. SL306]WAC53823.1 sensor histidine kinase [Gordonia sp. SL306]